MVFFGFGWLDRTEDAELSFGDRRRIVVVSDAGPVSVVSGDENRARHVDSFLLRRPTIELGTDDDEAVFRIRCDTSWPCRANTEIEVVPGVELVIISTNGTVQITSFSGDLTVFSDHDDVYMGPVSGSARVVSTSGDIAGFGLGLEQLTVEVGDAEMDLEFALPPLSVVLNNSQGDVALWLPDSGYRLMVRTENESVEQVDIQVGVDEASDATVSIRSGGAVTVLPFVEEKR